MKIAITVRSVIKMQELGYRCSLLYKAFWEEEREEIREFKRADEMFTYAKISYRKKRGMIRESIFIKCPKCGKVGKLRRNRRHYYIYHKYQSCHIGTCSEFYDFVDEIYRMYRSSSSLTEEVKKGKEGIECELSR